MGIRTSAVLLFILLLSNNAKASWQEEKKLVTQLLNEILKVDGVFIRNGKSYSPKEAVEHLRMKLKNAQNSWFAPSKEKWTAQMFIEKIASKSSLSDKAYRIRFKDGVIVDSSTWLKKKLKELKNIPRKVILKPRD